MYGWHKVLPALYSSNHPSNLRAAGETGALKMLTFLREEIFISVHTPTRLLLSAFPSNFPQRLEPLRWDSGDSEGVKKWRRESEGGGRTRQAGLEVNDD